MGRGVHKMGIHAQGTRSSLRGESISDTLRGLRRWTCASRVSHAFKSAVNSISRRNVLSLAYGLTYLFRAAIQVTSTGDPLPAAA